VKYEGITGELETRLLLRYLLPTLFTNLGQ